MKRIISKSPTRIDLGGGTLDIWPLYLFLDHPTTLNLGIDLTAEAVIESSPGISLRSEDQNVEMSLEWKELSTATAPPQLELHLKLLRHFVNLRKQDPGSGLRLITRARSPAGAGLGGSSSLSVAISGALSTWAEGKVPDPALDGVRLIRIVRDTETTVIQVPAGLQDYYGAMFGGLQSLRWRAGSHERQSHPEKVLRGLERRLLLFYSGQSRNSGINNWALFKDFIDRQPRVREVFQSIADATVRMEAALLSSDWQEAGKAIQDEWQARKGLARGISTPEIEQAFELAREQGGAAAKICGAGGGGCFFIYLNEDDQEKKDRIRKAIRETLGGIREIPFRAVTHGLEIQCDTNDATSA